jgi:hypothetical protein
MKTCPGCKLELENDKFGIHKNRYDGLQTYCKSCSKEKYEESRRVSRLKCYHKDPEKTKTRNREWNNKNKDKRRIQSKRYYLKNKEKVHEWHMQYSYGITRENREEILKSQNDSCAICGKPANNVDEFDVDHCHNTGTVRGLLCHKCNTGIGFFEDDPELLTKAIQYLVKPDND